MIYKLLLITILISSLYSAKVQEPTATFEASGFVTDLIYKDGKLYAATDASSIDIFDIETKKLIQKITVSKIKDFMGDTIDSKIYSVDIFEDKIMILSQAKRGARRVHIYKDNKLELILPYTEKLFIGKAKFIDKNTILLGLLGNDIISYDIKKKKQNWITQVSQSKFSNFILNEDKTEVIIADESGDIKIHKTKDGSFIKMLSGQNLDNVFQVDRKKNIIATAGQDRRIAIYNTELNSSYYKTAKFLIYSVGLSPSAKLVGFSSDEENNVKVFKTSTKSDLGIYGGNKGTLTNILFINEKEFFVSSESTTINFYKIK